MLFSPAIFIFHKVENALANVYNDPKRAVVVVRGSAPGRFVLVPEGASMAEAAARLGLAVPSAEAAE